MGWNGTHSQVTKQEARDALPGKACKMCVHRLRVAEFDLRAWGDFTCPKCDVNYQHKV